MSVLKFKGHKAASGKNVDYIMRDSACRDVSFHNLDELQGENEHESKINARSYVYNREDEETGRNHYRLTLTWEGKEDTEKARQMSQEYLKENFKDSRAIVAIHQDTDHTHAHVWIDARQNNGKKIHTSRGDQEKLYGNWQKQYDREYGTNRAKEFAEKRQETRENKKARAQGLDVEMPKDRAPKLTAADFREKDARDAGVRSNGIDKEGIRGNQRPFEVRNSNANESEQTLNRSKQDFEQSNQAVDSSQQRLNQSKYAVDRADSQANGTIRETQKLRESVEEYGRATSSQKVKDQDRGAER
jgi:hypothetical protein